MLRPISEFLEGPNHAQLHLVTTRCKVSRFVRSTFFGQNADHTSGPQCTRIYMTFKWHSLYSHIMIFLFYMMLNEATLTMQGAATSLCWSQATGKSKEQMEPRITFGGNQMAGRVVTYVWNALCPSSGTISTSRGTLPSFAINTAIGHHFLPSS